MSTLASKKDFKIEWFSGSGAGGQHRNKHQNCCRIRHIPTGMTETGQRHRERSQNQREAFRRLANRVVDLYLRAEARERYGNTEIIRTYHAADNRVKDHASGFVQPYTVVIGQKKLGPMIEARRVAMDEDE